MIELTWGLDWLRVIRAFCRRAFNIPGSEEGEFDTNLCLMIDDIKTQFGSPLNVYEGIRLYQLSDIECGRLCEDDILTEQPR